MFKGWLAALVVAAYAAVPTPAAESATSELEAVVERLNALDTWIDDAGKRLASQQKRLSNADRRIAAIAKRIRTLRTHIAKTEVNLAQLATQRKQLDEQCREQSERLAEHLHMAWRYSAHETVKVILNQEDPDAYDRIIRYHGYFAKARTAAIVEFRATLAALDENEQTLHRVRNSLQAAERSLGSDRAALLQERAKRQELIANLHSGLSDKNKERRQLEESRQRLAALIADIEQRTPPAVTQPTGTGLGTAGDLPWPVQGQVHRRFGQERAGGRMRWQGMVIRAPLGSEIHAVAAGRVVFADWLRGFGLLAIVDHGDDHMSLYGYADALYKRAGDRVEGGEPIAAVGQSGGQADMGLYFEIRHGGKPIDPRQWLQSHVAN